MDFEKGCHTRAGSRPFPLPSPMFGQENRANKANVLPIARMVKRAGNSLAGRITWPGPWRESPVLAERGQAIPGSIAARRLPLAVGVGRPRSVFRHVRSRRHGDHDVLSFLAVRFRNAQQQLVFVNAKFESLAVLFREAARSRIHLQEFALLVGRLVFRLQGQRGKKQNRKGNCLSHRISSGTFGRQHTRLPVAFGLPHVRAESPPQNIWIYMDWVLKGWPVTPPPYD